MEGCVSEGMPNEVVELLRSFDTTGINYRGIRVRDALRFAAEKHNGQRRKYTHEPYVFHPVEVMSYVEMVTLQWHAGREDMLCAALLHDVVEDTDVTLADVRARFGDRVARMVDGLTDVSLPSDGNREARKAIDRSHTAEQSADTQTIKLADLISNARSIVEFDEKFARVYLREKSLLLSVLHRGSGALQVLAREMLADSMKTLEMRG